MHDQVPCGCHAVQRRPGLLRGAADPVAAAESWPQKPQPVMPAELGTFFFILYQGRLILLCLSRR